MKFMATWSVDSDNLSTVAERFLSGKAATAEGLTRLGHWINTNGSGGWSLFETDDSARLFENSLIWADVMDIHIEPVIDEMQAGPLLMGLVKRT